MITKIAAGVAACLFSCSAFAVQKDITVTATIDTALEVLSSDGSPLPNTVNMTYVPGRGLLRHEMMTKIYSNAADKDMEIRLVNTPELVENTGMSPVREPLKVSYMNQEITSAPKTLAALDVFPSGSSDSGSIDIPLHIEQATQRAFTKNGRYSGVVSIALVHPAAGP